MIALPSCLATPKLNAALIRVPPLPVEKGLAGLKITSQFVIANRDSNLPTANALILMNVPNPDPATPLPYVETPRDLSPVPAPRAAWVMPRHPDANPAGNVSMTVIALLLQLAEKVDALTHASANAVKELFVTSLHIKLFALALPVLWVTRGQSADNWNALKIPTVQWEDPVFKANVLMPAGKFYF